MDYFYIISLFVFTLLFRSTVRILFPKLIDYDTYFHIFMINFIREHGTSEMIEHNRFIKPSGMNYPWMIHKILSLFPKKMDSFLERFTNPILDSLFVVILYYVTFIITGSNEKSLMLGLLYIFTPATFSIFGTGPRIKSFTPRLFGEIIGSLVFIFEYLYLESGNFLFLGLAIFSSSVVFLASKFAVQALVFINIPLIGFTQAYELLSVIFIGFILAMIYSRGKYLDILGQQSFHLKEYFIENLKGKMEVSDRNNFKVLFSNIIQRKYKNVFRLLISKNSYFILIYKVPIIFIGFYYIYLSNDYLSFKNIMIYSGAIIFLVTSLRIFLFIGEAERYVNYILFFILLNIVNNVDHLTFYSLIVYGLVYYLFDLFIVYKSNNKFKSNDNDILISWLNNIPGNLNIGTVPYGLGGWRIVTDTEHNRLYGMVYIDKNERETLTNFQIKHPILNINEAQKIIDYYSLDYLIYNEKYLKKEGILIQKQNSLNHIQISENIFAFYK